MICILNKVDLIPGYPLHIKHTKRFCCQFLFKEFTEYGISESEGTSLLRDEESSRNIRIVMVLLGIYYMFGLKFVNLSFDQT